MNIIFEKKTDKYIVKLAEFKEEPEILHKIIKNDLIADEKEYYKSIKNNKRKREWLGTRILLKNSLTDYTAIHYDNKGNPFLENNFNISITHTGNFVGIILSKNKETGIDAEIISERIIKTAHKFISEKELLELSNDRNKLEKIFLHWCGKEVLFKIKGDGGYDFMKDFEINPFKVKKEGILSAKIKKYKFESYKLHYQFINHNDTNILLVFKP